MQCGLRRLALIENRRFGSFATGSDRQQVRACPLLRRKRKYIQGAGDVAVGLCGLMALTET